MINDLLKKVYDQKIEAGQIDEATWKYNTAELWKGVREGWGKLPAMGSTAQLTQLELRRNVNVYSAFKNHANVIELTQALVSKDGKPLTFGEFKKLANPIAGKYNETWLKTEYNYATRAAHSAAQWQKLKEKGGKIEYKTVGDGRVRDEHRKLNGIILPVDDLFWTNYFPPNGWNCRCFVRSRPDDTENNYPTSIPEVNPMFQNNVGVTGQIFTDEHPFIKEVGQLQASLIRNEAEKATLTFERGFVKDQLRQNVQGSVIQMTMEGKQVDVSIAGNGIGKALSQKSKYKIDQLRSLLAIKKMMKDAKYEGLAPDLKANKEVIQWHYFTAQNGDRDWTILVWEDKDKLMRFYTLHEKVK